MSETMNAAPAAETAPVEAVETSTESLETEGAIEAEMEGSEESSSEASTQEQSEAIDKARKDGKISKKQADALKKQLKIKVDGREETVELDLSNDEELKRHLQKAKAFDKRAKEYSELKGTVENFMQQLLSGDDAAAEAALAQIGMNPEEFATKLLERKIKELEKSPEQIERERMQKELEELRAEKKRIQEEKEAAEMEKLRDQYAAEIEREIMEAIDGTKSVLPRNNPRVTKRVAQTMLHAMENGYHDVTVQDIIPIVEKEWKEELRSYFDSSAEDMIEELVGKHNFDRLRQKRLAKRPTAPKGSVNNIKDTGSKPSVSEDNKPKKSLKSFLMDE